MALVKNAKRFEVWLIALDPTKGSEIQKTRPCLVVSPDEMNAWLRTIIIAPMTTAERSYPSRVSIHFDNKDGQVALDQLRCVDKNRLVKKLGVGPENTQNEVVGTLTDMFTL